MDPACFLYVSFLFKRVHCVALAAEAEASATDTSTEDFRKQLIEKILLVLNSGSDEECAICLDGLKSPVITHCAHLFCRHCIVQVINAEKVGLLTVALLMIFLIYS